MVEERAVVLRLDEAPFAHREPRLLEQLVGVTHGRGRRLPERRVGGWCGFRAGGYRQRVDRSLRFLACQVPRRGGSYGQACGARQREYLDLAAPRGTVQRRRLDGCSGFWRGRHRTRLRTRDGLVVRNGGWPGFGACGARGAAPALRVRNGTLEHGGRLARIDRKREHGEDAGTL